VSIVEGRDGGCHVLDPAAYLVSTYAGRWESCQPSHSSSHLPVRWVVAHLAKTWLGEVFW
jgi:hypothetical protein